MSTTDTTSPRDEPSTGKASPRVPSRRRRWVWITATALVLGAVAGNAVLIEQLADREPMLVLARDVAWGQQVSGPDVTTADLPADAHRFAIPEDRRHQVLGLVATQNLTAGELLARHDLSPQVIPGPGQRVVGLRLEPGRYPARGLAPNDPVAVHLTPDDTNTNSGGAAAEHGEEFSARVVRASAPDAEGAIVVDLLVPEATAPAAVEAAVRGAHVSLLGPAEE
ncbi:SAF domain-containing protein [Saccharopolyspora cebuensis]|uniref:SAF domain-containing protein n=1 Tax=Saccharopolyspora cebuensis TaxID=418759 RepID=A0ABV4CNR3_9PSEU